MAAVAAPGARYTPRLLRLEAPPPRGFNPRLLPALEDIVGELRRLVLEGLTAATGDEFIAYWTESARWGQYRSLLDAYFGLRARIVEDGFAHVLEAVLPADAGTDGDMVRGVLGDEASAVVDRARARIARSFAQLPNLLSDPTDLEKDRALHSHFEDHLALYGIGLNSITAIAAGMAHPTAETASVVVGVLAEGSRQVEHAVTQALALREKAIDVAVARLAHDAELGKDVARGERDLHEGKVITLDALN